MKTFTDPIMKFKKGGMKLKKNLSSETTEPISTKLKTIDKFEQGCCYL